MDKIYEETTQEWYDAYFQFIQDNWEKIDGNPTPCLWLNSTYRSKYSTSLQLFIENNFSNNITFIYHPYTHTRDRIPDPEDTYFWERLSKYNDLTWTIVEQHLHNSWDWEALSYHPCVTWDIIQQHPENPWDWKWIGINPNIGFEIIQQHPEKPWDWAMICSNDMRIARENTIRQNSYPKLREWFAKSDLKRELMEKLWHPCTMHKWSGWGVELEEEEE